MAYDVEKRGSKHPEKFGRGYQAVAAAEGANSTCGGGFVPSSLNPSGPALAVLLGSFMMYGLSPAPGC